MLSLWPVSADSPCVCPVVLAVLAFLHALPLAVGLESARNMLVRVRLGHVLPNASRWNNMLWFFVVAPALVLVLVFGALVVGSAAHLRTAHGVSDFWPPP